ncbi:MAG: lysozyme [Comamonadaceae bacterium]|nr:lysozyme [Comamonadaceae bacterium]
MNLKQRLAVGSLSLSAAAFVGLLVHEGYSERAYPDPTHGTKVPTVGFGSTGPDVTMQTRLPPVPAAQRALRDVQRFEGAIKQCVRVPLSQAEYDTYVHLAYNIGPSAFCGSGIVRQLNQGRYRAACDQILRWRYSAGQDCSAPGNRSCRGLWARRQAEHAQCIAAVDAVEGRP